MRIEQALWWAKQQLAANDVSDDGHYDSSGIDAKAMLCAALSCETSYLHTWPEKLLTDQQQQDFQAMIAKRMLGEPVAYIIGYRDFWSLTLKVSPATLIPRAETELLVELALDLALPKAASVLDLGTGTGAIALALASEKPAWQITGVDFNNDAVALARENATICQLNRVQFEQSDWFSSLAEKSYDLILSNPPYVENDAPQLTVGDVRFEPASALTSGADGLDDIRLIINNSQRYLNRNGWLLIEHGYQQGQAVVELMQQANFSNVVTRVDLNNLDRMTMGTYSCT